MTSAGAVEKRSRCTYNPTETDLMSMFPRRGQDPHDPVLVEGLTRFMNWASVMVKDEIFKKMTGAHAVGKELWGFRMIVDNQGLIDGWLPVSYVLDAVLCYKCARERVFDSSGTVPRCKINIDPRIVSDAEAQLHVVASSSSQKPIRFGVSCVLAHWNLFRLTISIFPESDW